jgi:hypothetical protein
MSANREFSQYTIKSLHSAGNFPYEILIAMVGSGIEYPDAVTKVALALRMDDDEISWMIESYEMTA